MAYPVFTAGMTLTAALLEAMQWQEVVQGNDQSVASSTTFVDSALVIPVEANARYRYRLLAGYRGSSAGDIMFQWIGPTGFSMERFAWGPGSDATSATGAEQFTTALFRRIGADIDVTAAAGASASANVSYHEEGTITTGNDAGNVTLQFTQASSNATATVLAAQSTLFYVRIG